MFERVYPYKLFKTLISLVDIQVRNGCRLRDADQVNKWKKNATSQHCYTLLQPGEIFGSGDSERAWPDRDAIWR